MVLQLRQPITTIDEFITYAMHPENSERNIEFIDGEMIEKMPGTTENSTLAFYLGFIVQSHCEKNNIPCYISGEAGAYRIGNNVLAPDFAYTNQHRLQPSIPTQLLHFGLWKSFRPMTNQPLFAKNGSAILKPVFFYGNFIPTSA